MGNNKGISTVLVVAFIAAIVLAGGIIYYMTLPQSLAAAQVTSGGASFPYPIVTKWISEYNKINPQIQITYQSVGSGAGKNNLISKIFDFAGTDATLSNAELANYTILHIPETAGGVVIAYNIPGINVSGMNLTANLIANIFQGAITKWNDPSIAAINPSVTLPDQDIVTVHRSDSSGTTSVFTTYLANASSLWLLGKGTTVAWPSGLAGSGNSGVASIVRQTPYSVGYLEFFYAKNNSIPYAHILSTSGQFVEPTLTSISNAAKAGVPLLQQDIRTSIVNLAGDAVYPISAFTYYIVWKDLTYMGEAKAKAVVNFMWWCVHDGQQYSEGLLFPKLPTEVVALNEALLRSITYNGQSIIK
jgi:phosphate transport system substrate-binding protein